MPPLVVVLQVFNILSAAVPHVEILSLPGQQKSILGVSGVILV